MVQQRDVEFRHIRTVRRVREELAGGRNQQGIQFFDGALGSRIKAADGLNFISKEV